MTRDLGFGIRDSRFGRLRGRSVDTLIRLAAIAVALGVIVSAQNPEGSVQITILSPGPDAYVSGPTLLRARVDPEEAASAVAFFVGGRQICVITAPPWECDWDAGPSVSEHQVRAVATLRAGGRIVQTSRTKALGYSERVNVEVVQVTVTVGDGRGRFVRGIPRSAFHIAEDGKPQTITHFASEDVPLELIAAVDISGSMGPSMPKVKKAVKEFLGAVPSHDLVTLIGFNDNIITLTRKTMDQAERVKAVDRLAPWGSTALYDTLLRGTDMLGRQTGRKAFVVFTDSVDELHDAFNDLLDELGNQYLLGYVSTNNGREDAWRKIKVDVDGHHEVRARQGYRVMAAR